MSNASKTLVVFPIHPFPLVKEGMNVGKSIIQASLKTPELNIVEGDVVVVAHTIISTVEGNTVDLSTVTPSKFAENIAKMGEKDPRLVEVVLRESRSVVRMSSTVLITESKLGTISANAGVDKSNSPGDTVVTLPRDPDKSAREIRNMIKETLGKTVAVIISDTFGQPFRVGTTNVAIGCAGIQPIEDCRGRSDLFGYILEHTLINRADEIATAAGHIMGQADEQTPVVIVRGANYQQSEESSARVLTRVRETALFW